MAHEDEISFFPTLRREVDDFFRQALRPVGRRGIAVESWNPQLDLTEEEDRFVLEADLPGVRREDIRIEVQGRNLVVSGSRNIVRSSRGTGYSHYERFSGSFVRTLALPAEVDETGIRASLDKGILVVELPKKGRGL